MLPIVLAASLFLSSVFTEQDNGRTVAIYLCREFDIALDSPVNNTHDWEIADFDRALLRRKGIVEHVADDLRVAHEEVRNRTWFHFVSVAEGRTTVHLKFRRADGSVDRQFRLHVLIRTDP
jgi:hypothetical protein